MIAYLLRRLAVFIPVLLCIAVLSYLLVYFAPGSPFSSEKNISGETLIALKKEYGLDKPLPAQILIYLKNVSRGYLGRSVYYRDRTVNEIIAAALPVSVRLGLLALLIALLTGVPIGVVSAWRKNRAADYAAMSLSMIGISVPSFVLAALLILLFSFVLHWLPAVGYAGPRTLVLPVLTLSAPYIAYLSRITRAGLLEVLNQEYIVTARAKGLSVRRTLFIHGLKNGIVPVISFLGPAAAGILTGSIVVEKIFAIPGLGINFIHSALHRDYFLAIGCALTYGLLLISFNLISDLLYAIVDPRVSYAGKR
jgi:oligopeptide transport system permease protein